MKHPIQPIVSDADGVLRFKGNAIVKYLFADGPFHMDTLVAQDFPQEDREQFVQLIGFSLTRFGRINPSDETAAEVIAASDIAMQAYKADPAAAVEAARSKKHPMQAVALDAYGVLRFRENTIVEHLGKQGPFDMNDLAVLDFSQEDREQFAQLTGYSVRGFRTLSYISDEAWVAACGLAEACAVTQIESAEAGSGEVSGAVDGASALMPDPVTGLVVNTEYMAGLNAALRAIAAIPNGSLTQTGGHEDAYRAVELLAAEVSAAGVSGHAVSASPPRIAIHLISGRVQVVLTDSAEPVFAKAMYSNGDTGAGVVATSNDHSKAPLRRGFAMVATRPAGA